MKDETTTAGALRIKPIPPPPEKQKISFRLTVPTIENLNTYLAAYVEAYGVEANLDFVAEQIFTSFFESDRAFVAYRRKKACATLGVDAQLGTTQL
uniref:DUF2274 domain-containing protein n=1 Tax=Geobacter sp. (strain M21) TaxID=443144 RepID=C6DZ82_GEOSM